LDKIQIIEKLFKYILESSYLLLPLALLLSKQRRFLFFQLLAASGILTFLFLHYFYAIPITYRRVQLTAFTLVEYSLFAYIFWTFTNSKNSKKIIVVLSFVFAAFQIIFFVTGSKIKKLDSVPIAIETFLIFFYIILYFRQFFKNNVNKNVYEYPSFWIVVGILLYLGTGFFFNLLVNHVTEEQFKNYWHYTFIPEIFKNLIFASVILGYPSLKNEYSKPKNKSEDIPNLDMI
jgi:hypothetical protein